MGLRVFRRVRIAPGFTMNISKHGPSFSAGVRGAHITIGSTGIRRTVGIPGTGVFYTSHTGYHSGVHSAPHFAHNAHSTQQNKGCSYGGCLASLGCLVFIILLVMFIIAICIQAPSK
ncbi:MAG: DUF4236 domain-containing protein [Phycisphaerae bacterium]|nr:DUF4236 domain-containing protein [Phycisphaerae bacterium]